MQVGVVKAADDADLARLRVMCTRHDDWRQVYRSNVMTVYEKSDHHGKIVKVTATMNETAANVYDVWNDDIYAAEWKSCICQWHSVFRVSSNSDIGCRVVKMPKFMANREFVTQREWRDFDSEMMTFCHSVDHVAVLPKRNCIRAVCYLDCFHVMVTANSKYEAGCVLMSITQYDLQGIMPSWLSTMLTRKSSVKVIKKLVKACLKYRSWKQEHFPLFKPWIHGEQIALPQLSATDIREWELTALQDRTSEVVEEVAVVVEREEVEFVVESDDDVAPNGQQSVWGYVTNLVSRLWSEGTNNTFLTG